MMGPNHVLSGLCAGVATLPLAGRHDAGYQTVWVLAWGGAALLPDLDQEGALAPSMWGPVSELPAALIGRLAGGHRWGTHDLILSPLIVGALFWAARFVPDLHLLALALMLGLVIRGLVALQVWRVGALVNLAASWAGACWLTGHGGLAVYDSWWLIAAGGVIVHALGDLITANGIPVPVLWIIRKDRIELPLHLTTGKGLEKNLLPVVWTVLLLALLSHHTGIHTWPQLQTASAGWLNAGVTCLEGEVGRLLREGVTSVLT